MLKNLLKICFYTVVMVFFIGCNDVKPKVVKVLVPPPPNEPRLFLETVYYGGLNFEESSFLDTALGELADTTSYNLAKPYGVVASNDGSIYVADTAYGVVFDINEKLKKVSLIGVGNLTLPVGLALDDEENIYVTDAKKAMVLVFDKKGKYKRVFGTGGVFYKPTGIAINSKLKIVYVVDTKDHNIKAFTLEGKKLFSFGKRGRGDGEFNFPTNIAIDKRNGNFAVVDTQNFRIQVFDKDGNFIRKFGKIGDIPGMFARPKGIGIDSMGNMYVTDSAFNNVQIFNDKGEVLTYFGGKGSDFGQYSLISGMYIDKNDRVYVVDAFNRRVQVYQYITEEWKKNNPAEYAEIIKK